MLLKAGKRQVLSLVAGIIILAGTFSLSGCITLSPGPSTQDNNANTETETTANQGDKLATLKIAKPSTGTFTKVAVNTALDNEASLASFVADKGWAIKGTGNNYGVGVAGENIKYGTDGNLGGVNAGVTGRINGSNHTRGELANKDAGVYGTSDHWGVWGDSVKGLAGYFSGNVRIDGTFSKSSGTFKIDHPQDPANKYLSHSFVESPDMMNVYNGNIILDETGEATVNLPSYFEVLNRDFRYQLTAIGAPGPNLYIASEISGNQFKIAGGKSGAKVSWQVTGIRQDPFANAHPVVVEEEKPANEKGLYLNPVEWGQPKEKSISQLTKP